MNKNIFKRPDRGEEPRKVGLARALSKLGFCSRSKAAEMIRASRVRLNGTIRKDPETPVRLGKDCIVVDGETLGAAQKVYLILNKPRGVITTAADEKGRSTVYSYLDRHLPWVGPVGRLDKASEGLLLLTNDTEWAGKILAPESHVDKTYHVQIGVLVGDALLRRLEHGVQTSGGEKLGVKYARLLRHGARNCWLEITLDEGKNRQIRRIFEQLSIEVLRLVRVALGPLSLGDLPKGSSRPLTPGEKSEIDRELKK